MVATMQLKVQETQTISTTETKAWTWLTPTRLKTSSSRQEKDQVAI
jgi:hypothetical protein